MIDAATDTVGEMYHLFLAVHHMDKDRVVGARIKGASKLAVFCQTKRLCDKVARSLVDLGVDAAAIHGDLPQVARERALRQFADGRLAVLVATDVAARGLDIDGIGAVVHYDPPKGRQGLPAPLRPHGSCRPGRMGGHDGRVQPAHADAHPAAHVASADRPADRGLQQRRALAKTSRRSSTTCLDDAPFGTVGRVGRIGMVSLVAVAVLTSCGDDDDSTDATLGPLDAAAGVTTPGATIGTGDPAAVPATTVDPATAGAGFVSIQVRLPASGIDETLALDRATVSVDALDPVSLDAFCSPLDGGPEMAARSSTCDASPTEAGSS